MKHNVYTICFAGILGTVCVLLPTAVASFTASYEEANADAQRKRNIPNVLQVPYPAEASSYIDIAKYKLDEIENSGYKKILSCLAD